MKRLFLVVIYLTISFVTKGQNFTIDFYPSFINSSSVKIETINNKSILFLEINKTSFHDTISFNFSILENIKIETWKDSINNIGFDGILIKAKYKNKHYYFSNASKKSNEITDIKCLIKIIIKHTNKRVSKKYFRYLKKHYS